MDMNFDTVVTTDESYIEKLIIDMRNLKLTEMELKYESPAPTQNPFEYLDEYESGSECYEDDASSESEYVDPYYSEFIPENPDDVSCEEEIVLFTEGSCDTSADTVSDIIVKSVEEDYVSQHCDNDDAVVSEVFNVPEPDEEYFGGEYDVVDVPKAEETTSTSGCSIM